MQWHVNNTLLDGERVDIEIYRCRDLIDKCPVYQAYLAQVNAVKTKYKEELLTGIYKDELGFSNSNGEVDARAYVSEDGSRTAIVAANQHRTARVLTTRISVPGCKLLDATCLGKARLNGTELTLGQYDIAVLLFGK